MTISVETNKVTFVGNASDTVFASGFKVFDDDDIQVEIVTDSTSAVVVQTKTTDYTVSAITSPSSAVNITMLSAPAIGETVVLRRAQPQLQSTDYVENDNLPAQTVENDNDKAVMMVQDLQEQLDRSLKLDPSQTLSTFLPSLESQAAKVVTVNAAETGFQYDTLAAVSLDIDGLVEDTIASGDTLAFYDASDAENNKITFANLEATLNHDSLAGFAANKHIDWTSTSSALSTSGTAATGALTVTGAITVTSTVDGRDIATDGTKLDTIETSATADQTNAEIKTAYEANADTNEFSDAEQTKLSGIETAADVTDATNVNTAGAVMNSDSTTAGMSFVIDEDDLVSDLDTKVPTQQSVKAYVDAAVIPALTTEEVEDIAGPLVATGGTKTGISVTYQDITADMDFVVSDTTVAGDSGSTGITPGDTLTIAGGTEITTAMSGDTLTINADFTPSSTDTMTNKTFDANATGNSLSNVDVADLANGTDGELITWSAAGAPATVAVGTSTQVLTSNGVGVAPTFQSPAGGGDALTSNGLDQFAATTSAELAGVISNETGSGALVFATSPTLVTPALGTPASGVATNLTGTAASLTAGTVTTNANLTGDVTSSGNATTIAAGAVDVAMLANGTDGELITWDAAGAPDTVAVGTSGHVLTSGGTGVAPTFQAAAGGGAAAASQAEMESASSTSVYVSPGRQQYHPGTCKVWGQVSYSAGTPTMNASHNMNSVTDNGTGDITLTIATAFSAATNAVVLGCAEDGFNTGDFGTLRDGTGSSATAVRCTVMNAAGTVSDPGQFYWAMFGDQ